MRSGNQWPDDKASNCEGIIFNDSVMRKPYSQNREPHEKNTTMCHIFLDINDLRSYDLKRVIHNPVALFFSSWRGGLPLDHPVIF